jgi:hypothetical protein
MCSELCVIEKNRGKIINFDAVSHTELNQVIRLRRLIGW